MRIISGGLQHETNTFAVSKTSIDDFVRDSHFGADYGTSDDICRRFEGTNTIHGGYLRGAYELELDLLPVLNLRAYPSGMVLRECFETLVGELLSRIENALPADGVLLDLHGAMVTEDFEDAEAEIVRRVRELVGTDVPIVVTLDLHANISPDLAEFADVIIGFDTYPHIDMGDRGYEAVALMSRILKAEVRPVMAFHQLPLLTLPPMQCTLREPMQSFIADLHGLESGEGILTATVAMGFPFADIECMGVTVIVVTDDDHELAQTMVDRLAQKLWSLREELQPQLVSIKQAMDLSLQTDGLVIFADGSDNPGGGAPCDGTVALQALIEAKHAGAVVATLWDPEVVELAWNAGVGAELTVPLGGKVDNQHGDTLEVSAKVLRLSDGEFVFGGAMAQGLSDSLGNTALLEIEGVRVVVTSLRRQCIDRNMLGTVGVELDSISLLVLKSAVHFRADFGDFAEEILDADTPGIHRPDFSCFEYKNSRSHRCYPFSD